MKELLSMAKLGRPYGKSQGEKVMVRVDFYIEPEQAEYLDKAAETSKVSKAEIIRQALALWIQCNPIDNPAPTDSKKKNPKIL